MVDSYLGEIKLFTYSRVPRGWLPCEGQLLTIQQYQALFALLGIQFGGDGRNNFNLPDLRGRTPVHMNSSDLYKVGLTGGKETVALTIDQVAPHTHTVAVSTVAGTAIPPTGHVLAVDAPVSTTPAFNTYGPYDASKAVALAPTTVQPNGGSAGHENRQPSLALAYCIAIEGTFPMRT